MVLIVQPSPVFRLLVMTTSANSIRRRITSEREGLHLALLIDFVVTDLPPLPGA
jgi:hypothetical protein